ncbi:MAG: hypothetical protein JEZ00_17340 [Anaerolineaceae bacterium]|nr:hypothetical protein [Anaerolineaceae bacterium]
MLERDYLMIQYFSNDIIDRRIELLKSGMMQDAKSKKQSLFLTGMLNLFGILVLFLFLVFITG